MRHLAAATGLALLLVACNGSSDEDGTTVSFRAKGEDGNVTAMTDQQGRLSVDAPGFNGSIKLPKFQLDAEDFDLNGVHLYPGSKITAFNIDADGGGDSKDDKVHVRFESPATPKDVRDWLKSRLIDAGYRLEESGAGLVGTTEDGDPFRLELAPSGDNRTTGEITLTG